MAQHEELVKLAYSMAIGQQRYEDMLYRLGDAFSEAIAQPLDAELTQQDQDELSKLAPHFGNALTLLEQQGRRKLSGKSATRRIQSESNPVILISKSGQVLQTNAQARSVFDIGANMVLSSRHFEPEQYAELMGELSRIDEQPDNKIIRIFGMKSHDGEEIIRVALSRTFDPFGDIVGYLTAMHVSWYPEVGREFQTMLDLTPAELAITKAVVTGVTLNDLAEQRGRTISTVRNQTKQLLSKLNLRSQTELACLYSGFSKFSLQSPQNQKRDKAEETFRETHIICLANDRVMDYEIIGLPTGKPVMVLPGMLGGRAITDALRHEMVRRKIKLIMPWRPGFSQTTPDGPVKGCLDRYNEDLKKLYDHLKLESIPLVGHMTGAIFATAFAHKYPHHVSKLVGITGSIPIQRGPHTKYIDRGYKVRTFMMAKAPRIGRMMIHAFLAYIDSGYDVDFIRTYLATSPADQKFIEDEAVCDEIRRAYEECYTQGYECMIHEQELVAQDWHDIADTLPCPMTLISGAEDTIHPPKALELFVKGKEQYDLKIVEDTGHFVFYQRPGIWLEVVQ